ncbi:MAG: nucleotidyl transferase AbiEii/AbiGii toxin family protein [bacterium]
MHIEVLDKAQLGMLPLLRKFKDDFYLVGGTALALQIGHRISIDFDLFNSKYLNINQINSKLDTSQISRVLVKNQEQYTIVYNNVNLTFFSYPFPIKPNIQLGDIFNSVDIITIGAMKAYALGRRSKWKDYVDLYFILQQFKVKDVIEKCKDIYGLQFNDKLFLEQLCYFEDIDFSQSIVFQKDTPDSNKIKQFLINSSMNYRVS